MKKAKKFQEKNVKSFSMAGVSQSKLPKGQVFSVVLLFDFDRLNTDVRFLFCTATHKNAN